jgi:hypothetical protein
MSAPLKNCQNRVKIKLKNRNHDIKGTELGYI